MKRCTTLTTTLIEDSEAYKQFMTTNFTSFLERAAKTVRRIWQEQGEWSDNTEYEKLLLRQAFDLVEDFIDYCPSQLPCRPALLLDGYILNYFGKPDKDKLSTSSDPVLKRFIDALLNKAVLSRDALISLFYHLYGLRPRDIGGILGLPEDQMQRIYKNFARWRKRGWSQAMEETGLHAQELKKLLELQKQQPEFFNEQVQEIATTLSLFYRKSDPPYYPCLSDREWDDMITEGSGLDYRMWHLPFCCSCLNTVVGLRETYALHASVQYELQILPHSIMENEVFQSTK